MLPPHYKISEYRSKRRDIISNKQKKLFLMSIRDEVNCDLVSVSVDESHGDMRWNKSISFLFDPKNLTVDLTATSNSEHYSVDTNDDENQNYELSTTNDEKIMKPKIQLMQLNNHLVMQYKLRQIYSHILLKYI